MNGLSSIAAAFVGVNARSNNASPRRLAHYIYYSNTPEDRALGMSGIMTIFI